MSVFDGELHWKTTDLAWKNLTRINPTDLSDLRPEFRETVGCSQVSTIWILYYRGFPKFASQIWQISWINYKKLNQHNKTNYFLLHIKNLLFIIFFILSGNIYWNLNALTNLFEWHMLIFRNVIKSNKSDRPFGSDKWIKGNLECRLSCRFRRLVRFRKNAIEIQTKHLSISMDNLDLFIIETATAFCSSCRNTKYA